MDRPAFARLRIATSALVAVTVFSLLVWQQLHGGVPSHSFMARDDMPSISNWWGAVTLPALTWFALGNIGRRVSDGRVTSQAALAGAAGALLFGAVLATAYELRFSAIPSVQIRMVPLIALFVPIFRAEYLLGFVLALAYTFGGVLPLLIGSVLALLGGLLHLGPRWLLRRFRVKR